MPSLTLEAEYMEYRGQGKRATPEEMFKMSPFCLKGKEAKFWLICCLPHLEKEENKGTRVNAGETPSSLGFHGH